MTRCGYFLSSEDDHVAAVGACAPAAFDEVYVDQIGPDQARFFDVYRTEVLPRLNAEG